MKKNLFSGALSVFLFGSCLCSTSFPCFAEKPYSAGSIYNGSNTQIGSISGDGSI